MGNTSAWFRQLYFKSTGYSFPNIGRMFMRLFVGLMLAQFGVRQLMGVHDPAFVGVPLVSEGLQEWLVIIVEIICPFFIMIGLFMRPLILLPFALMIVSCHRIVTLWDWGTMPTIQMLCVPFLFMGILLFLMIAGPGKISVDYFFSLYLINRHQDKDKEEDLEVV